MSTLEYITRSEREKKLNAAAASSDSRSGAIVRTSLAGIAANMLLVAIKITVGVITRSVAIVSDGVNNLTDAFSSILVIVGAYLACKKPDQRHPFGYGRIEYVVTIIIGALVIITGANTLHEAIEHIITPVPVSYSTPLIVALVFALVIKLGIGLFFRLRGKQLEAETLTASGTDALFDTLLSIATIVAAIISMTWGVSVEAYLAVVISALILKTGFEILMGAVSQILGQRVSTDVSAKVRKAAEGVPGVLRACNMRIIDFGPEHVRGTLYVEVDERISAPDFDKLTQAVQMAVFMQCGVLLDAVGMYPVNCTDPAVAQMRDRVAEIVAANDQLIDMHAFRLKPGTNLVMLDVVAGFDAEDDDALCEQVANEAEEAFPDYRFLVTTDSDFA